MIIVKLMGGLGNQMFQYALGRRLALRKNVPLKLDLSWFSREVKRRYALDQFQIVAEIATTADIQSFTKSHWPSFFRKIFEQFRTKYPQWLGQLVMHPNSGFYPQALQIPKKAYLNGYWQSEKYFSSIKSVLRKDFQLKTPFSDENEFWVEQASQPFSVSVHVRRTDYVENKRTNRLHGVCEPEYYLQSAAYLKMKVPQASFVVFSDDLPWARQNLDFLIPACFVEAGGPRKDEEELMLMSLCDHHIIANSTFSWWGAWLGANPQKIVIAPRQWLKDSSRDSNDRIPKGWIQI